MSKPSWSEAPEWANWLAADKGESYWVWYENEPTWIWESEYWYPYTGQWLQDKRFRASNVDSQFSLEQRP